MVNGTGVVSLIWLSGSGTLSTSFLTINCSLNFWILMASGSSGMRAITTCWIARQIHWKRMKVQNLKASENWLSVDMVKTINPAFVTTATVAMINNISCLKFSNAVTTWEYFEITAITVDYESPKADVLCSRWKRSLKDMKHLPDKTFNPHGIRYQCNTGCNRQGTCKHSYVTKLNDDFRIILKQRE